MLGVIFSLLSAATFALNAAAARRAVLSGTVLQGLAVTVPIGVPLALLVAWAFGQAGNILDFSTTALFWLALAGIIHLVAGRYANYRASSEIGTNLASNVVQCDVLITLVLAVWLLGEHLTPLRAIGIALVLIGPMLAYRRQSDKHLAAKPPGAFVPKYASGYFYAAIAAVCYGVSPVLVGLGLKGLDSNYGLAAVFVSYLFATVFFIAVLPFTGHFAGSFRIETRASRWFVFAGIFAFLAQVFRYVALSLAPVSVVTTLQRLSSIFRIYFGWLLNRDHEVFESRVFIATGVSLTGAVALSISTDLFLSLANWPPWLVELTRMRWP